MSQKSSRCQRRRPASAVKRRSGRISMGYRAPSETVTGRGKARGGALPACRPRNALRRSLACRAGWRRRFPSRGTAEGKTRSLCESLAYRWDNGKDMPLHR